MANSSSILAWNIPWTEEPGGQGPKESDTTEHSTWSWSWRLLKALSMNSVFFFLIVDEFPVAAVINYYRLHDLKQPTFMIFQF